VSSLLKIDWVDFIYLISNSTNKQTKQTNETNKRNNNKSLQNGFFQMCRMPRDEREKGAE